MGVQRHTVPHFKGQINAKVELEAQGRDTTFIMGHALLKKATLHLKTAIFFCLTVICWNIPEYFGILSGSLGLKGFSVLFINRKA